MENRSAELFLERRSDLQRNVINCKSSANATIYFTTALGFPKYKTLAKPSPFDPCVPSDPGLPPDLRLRFGRQRRAQIPLACRTRYGDDHFALVLGPFGHLD